MPANLTHILIVLFVMTGVLGGAHYYLWRRLVRDSVLEGPWRQGLSWLVLFLLLSQPLAMVFGRALPRESVSAFAFVSFTWLGLLSTFFSLLVVSDLSRLLYRGLRSSLRVGSSRADAPKLAKEGTLRDPQRRQSFQKVFAGGVALSGGMLGGVALDKGLSGFKIVEIEVVLEKLPQSFDGLRIVQLTDIHVGPTIGREFVEAMVKASNALNPDIVAITGDLVDGSVENLARHTEPLKELSAKHGVYFVTGNHDYYSGAEAWVAEVKSLGIKVLRNEAVKIRRGPDYFLLAGVNDYRAAQYGDAPDLGAALRDRKPEEEVVLLAHQPREVARATALDVGLQISGHTHGGQFWPWSWVIHLIEPVVSGLAKFGRTQIYVSCGTGYWGPPMRLDTEAEITVITLRASSDGAEGALQPT